MACTMYVYQCIVLFAPPSRLDGMTSHDHTAKPIGPSLSCKLEQTSTTATTTTLTTTTLTSTTFDTLGAASEP